MSLKSRCSQRVLAMLLAVLSIFTMVSVPAFAAQENGYHDPAEHWLTANNRTNELDANAVVTHETFHCSVCAQPSSFMVWRTPEYTRDGVTAMSRNVKYSDGTCADGESTGIILDGTPGVDARYTGYHWTKAMCEICGTMHSNGDGYALGKNVYYLYDCAAEFMEDLPQEVSYAYADSTYHTKTTKGGSYCCFCYGTYHDDKSVLERHVLNTTVTPQPANQRFAVKTSCALCEYEKTSYIAAKSVVSDYYGVVDGQPHTLTVADLSESGVNAQIRYGNSASACTLTAPPSYTEEGQYTVYYEITYAYNGKTMTENGVAYVWLYDESKDGCSCGCGDPDCDCGKGDHDGGNCGCGRPCKPCDGTNHSFTKLDSVKPTCQTLGYDRYLCVGCGKIEKRDYTNALGHAWQSVVIREATCETDGKTMNICQRCGEVEVNTTGKGEHEYTSYPVAATCVSPGYTVKECGICGDRHITDITSALAHNYKSQTIAATCENGGKTIHHCDGCGSSFVTDYTSALGHQYGEGKTIAKASCVSEGVTEYTCSRCGATKLETIKATGHTPGETADCDHAQTCTTCGAVIEKATGHKFVSEVTPATCEDMGCTTYTCENCGVSYKSDYTKILGHDYVPVVTAPTCTEGGFTTYTCSHCGGAYESDYTEPAGHKFDAGTKVIDSTCNSEGMIEYNCENCDYHYLEAVSPKGHTPGAAATCTQPQLCTVCGAVLANATGHSYKAEVTAPTCTKMGFTTYTCESCGDSYVSDHTDPTGHRESGWIVDKEPTTEAEGSRHKECEVCGEKLQTEAIEKLYLTATTDSKGEAVVGGYLVIVTDTDSKNPVSNAQVTLNKSGSISIRLPNSRILDYADQTTVTVLLTKDKSPVQGMILAVTDKNDNYCAGATDKSGQLTVPASSGYTNGDGKVTFGYEDKEGNRQTLTVIVTDHETGRPIENAYVTIDRLGRLVVKLPDGTDMDEDNRIQIVVLGKDKKPVPDVEVIVSNDLGNKADGNTDKDGTLIVPVVEVREYHGAYIYGYPDSTFGPERNMTRSEAAAIFARLLSEAKDERIPAAGQTKFKDVPADAWYSGEVKYLTNYGVVFGTTKTTFSPNDEISRAEFVTMAVRFFEVCGGGNAEIKEQYTKFSDVSSGYWAAEYIMDAAMRGWIYGYGDGTFRAEQNITRAEVVTIVNRLLDRTADEAYIARNLRKLNTFSDMAKNHWAYLDVMESANAHTALYDNGESWQK